MNEENKELLTEYQKGYIHCLCKVISKGSKKVSDDLDELLFELNNADEGELRESIEDIASQYGVKLYIDHYTDWIEVKEGSGWIVTPDGKRHKIGVGRHEFETFDLILYKDEEDLKRLLELLRIDRADDDYHRELGRLYGYGEEEIEDFVRELKDNGDGERK